MLHSQAPHHLDDQIDPRRYLPEHLWQRWQSGEAIAGLEHLRAVLRAVLTYLPQQIAQERMVDPTGPAVAGTFTQATLMFADISGFTAMSERLTQLGREGAEVITGIVNDYFATMLEIIARHGGDLFKFGGDALLVCFSGEGAAQRACGAALAMQRAMARFAVIPTDQGTFNLRMKVGLGTGTLFLASLGSPERLEFGVMGPALGRMANAESIAEAGEVLCDLATRDAAGAEILAEEGAPGFFKLKGLAKETEFLYERGADIGFWDDVTDGRSLLHRAGGVIERLDALTPFISSRVLERIIATPGQLMIEGEHRLVTVLFANFYGIDEIIETLGADQADEITDIVNRHFTAMQSVIRKYGGIVNKVDTYAVGYRIMAVFGAPVAHEDDPARAVLAALEMQEAISDFNGPEGVETSAGRFMLKQRIGVNTGYVFAGNLGSTLRQEYSVMGDEVNLAARLMGVAAEGQVLISQSTARHVKGMFEWQERDPVEVKGKRQPVQNYRVLRSVAGREGRLVARERFFGREEELTVARALIDGALTGQGAVLDISGDPGVGKSRLVQELSAYAGERGMATLRGEAISYGSGIPYLPWIAVLHALFDFQEGEVEGPSQRRDKLIAGLEAAGLSEWSPIVGGVLSIDIPETSLTEALDAQLRQQRFFDVVLQLVQERANRTPLLLVLDDIQWADAVSLDLVSYVARNAPGSPLVVVIVHRPELEAPRWCEAEGCHTLRLSEMQDDDSLNLAQAVLGEGRLSPALRREILDRAQGNPLFVEEVTRELLESGAIRLEEDQEEAVPEVQRRDREPGADRTWVLDKAAAGDEVPTTLTGLIMSRIDRLEMTNRRLLQVAAVIGVSFRVPPLERVYPYGDLNGTLPRRLDQLVEMDLTEFVPPHQCFFRHTLTQQVAYGSLPFTRRRELHVRVGEDIEKRRAGELAEFFGVLARHFDEGRVFAKAFTYRVQAGDKARDEFANQAALDNYQRALEIAKELEADAEVEAQVLDVIEAMGDVLFLTNRYAEAIERFQEAIAHCRCTARRSSNLLSKIANAHLEQGQYDEALGYLAQGRSVLSESEQDQRSVEMAGICNLSGAVHRLRGEMEQAIEECEQGLAILAGLARDRTVLSNEGDLYNTLGSVYLDQGQYSHAAEAYERGAELRRQAGDLPDLARSYNNLARVAWAQGNLTEAGDYLQRLLEISQQIGNNRFLAFGYNNLGAVSFATGDAEQALDYYHTAIPLSQRIGDSFGVAQSRHNIGEALNALGEYAEARRYLERAADAFEEKQSELGLSHVYRLLAEVELALDNTASALDYAERARRIAASIGNPVWQGIAERIKARGQARVGDVAGAIQCLETSIAALGKSEDKKELARSYYEFGSLLAGQMGQEAQARDHLQQAIELFTAAGAEKEADQARAVLNQLDT